MIDELKETRRLKILLRQLGEERRRLAPSISSPRMDGMPRGGSGGGVEAQIDLRAELDERIRQTTQKAVSAEKRARAQMDGLTPELYSLCAYYYIGAMSIGEVITIMRISRSTFYNRIDELKSLDGDGQR